MARLNVLVCDNCRSEFTETPETAAAMTQVVIVQGGSRSHVYDLCPTCASGLAPQLPQRVEDWPRYVRKESVQEWLRHRNGSEWESLSEAIRDFTSLGQQPLSTDEKRQREDEGNFDHVRRPTEYGDG